MKPAGGTAPQRTRPLRMPPGWQPPYPAWESEFEQGVHTIAMVQLGVQYLSADAAKAHALAQAFLAEARRTAVVADLSHGEGGAGRQLSLVTAYWFDPAQAQACLERDTLRMLWQVNSTPGLPYGVFREVFNIPRERFETLHSGPEHRPGIAQARQEPALDTPHHGYWGSMRDRIPAAATDALAPEGNVTILEQSAHRVLLRPANNLAMIRSGQDYQAAPPHERREYLDDVEPHLARGMTYLRDEGRAIGCYDCRYLRFEAANRPGSPGPAEASGKAIDHTYGLALFESLAALEAWAEHHPTHLAIFGAFLRMAPRYGPNMRSRFWHEVSVLRANEQWMEYANCRPGTGLMPAPQPG